LKTYLDCIPCLLRHMLQAARAATDNEKLQRQVIDAVAGIIPQLPLTMRPPELAQKAYRVARRITGNGDPFREAKTKANEAMLALYPYLKEVLKGSEDPLLTACKLAIVGNSIDLAPNFKQVSAEELIETALTSPLAINDYQTLRNSLANSQSLLYIGDNSGEIVLDRLLIEEILKFKSLEINFVVRDSPVINDATMDDAIAVGLDKVVRVVSNGTDAPATILSQSPPEVLHLYHSADTIIAKGQGNYESLEGEPGNLFFFLRAKCEIVGSLIGVNLGDAVLKQQKL